MSTLPSQQDHWIETPHGSLFARRWIPHAAHGAPFMLFHDSLGSVELWRDFPARLAQTSGREVIAYDRLGFGRSAAYRGEWSTEFIRQEATHHFPHLCEQLQIARCIVFGHSVGGAMAATCAALHPQRCQALVTESTQAFVEERTLQGIRAAREEFAQPGQIERLRKYHGDKAEWVLAAWTETWLGEAFANWTLESLVTALDCPQLVIHGEQDEYGSLLHPQRIARLSSVRSETLILESCHHVPHREAPERVLEAVVGFVTAPAG